MAASELSFDALVANPFPELDLLPDMPPRRPGHRRSASDSAAFAAVGASHFHLGPHAAAAPAAGRHQQAQRHRTRALLRGAGSLACLSEAEELSSDDNGELDQRHDADPSSGEVDFYNEDADDSKLFAMLMDIDALETSTAAAAAAVAAASAGPGGSLGGLGGPGGSNPLAGLLLPGALSRQPSGDLIGRDLSSFDISGAIDGLAGPLDIGALADASASAAPGAQLLPGGGGGVGDVFVPPLPPLGGALGGRLNSEGERFRQFLSDLQAEGLGGDCLGGGGGASGRSSLDDASLPPDERKFKRVMANRQSAQRSRIRKLHYVSELEKTVTKLQSDLDLLTPQVSLLWANHQQLMEQNRALKARAEGLARAGAAEEGTLAELRATLSALVGPAAAEAFAAGAAAQAAQATQAPAALGAAAAARGMAAAATAQAGPSGRAAAQPAPAPVPATAPAPTARLPDRAAAGSMPAAAASCRLTDFVRSSSGPAGAPGGWGAPLASSVLPAAAAVRLPPPLPAPPPMLLPLARAAAPLPAPVRGGGRRAGAPHAPAATGGAARPLSPPLRANIIPGQPALHPLPVPVVIKQDPGEGVLQSLQKLLPGFGGPAMPFGRAAGGYGAPPAAPRGRGVPASAGGRHGAQP